MYTVAKCVCSVFHGGALYSTSSRRTSVRLLKPADVLHWGRGSGSNLQLDGSLCSCWECERSGELCLEPRFWPDMLLVPGSGDMAF